MTSILTACLSAVNIFAILDAMDRVQSPSQQHIPIERYSFIWTLVRLPIAAIALFLGGRPLVFLIFPFSGAAASLLTIAWIISGVTVAYLAFRWYQNDFRIFGGKDPKNTVAFAIALLSGINLGVAGLGGGNIGMSISSSSLVFYITGILYIASAFQLYKQWRNHGEKLFISYAK